MRAALKWIAVSWPGLVFAPLVLAAVVTGIYVSVFDQTQWRDQKAGLVRYCSEEHAEVFQHCMYQECMIDTKGSRRCREFRRRGY